MVKCRTFNIQKIIIVPRHSNVPIKLKHTSFALHLGGDSAHSLMSKEIKTTKITCHKILSALISALLVSKFILRFTVRIETLSSSKRIWIKIQFCTH